MKSKRQAWIVASLSALMVGVCGASVVALLFFIAAGIFLQPTLLWLFVQFPILIVGVLMLALGALVALMLKAIQITRRALGILNKHSAYKHEESPLFEWRLPIE